MGAQYRVNAPVVISEVIDSEVVIMNLRSGTYYSSDGSGAVIWSWIAEGYSIDQLERLAVHNYSGDSSAICEGISQFVDKLLSHELVTPTGATDAPLPDPELAEGDVHQLGEFEPARLEIYSNMQDLLQLDPVHDVPDEAGWPGRPTVQQQQAQ